MVIIYNLLYNKASFVHHTWVQLLFFFFTFCQMQPGHLGILHSSKDIANILVGTIIMNYNYLVYNEL